MKQLNLYLILAMVFMMTSACNEADLNRTNDDVSGEDSLEADLSIQQRSDMQQFVNMAASDGLMEVLLGEMAQQKSNDQAVKDLAQMIENDHQQANERLKIIVMNNELSFPETMMQEHLQTIDQLNDLSGREFSTRYVEIMIQNHEKAIKNFQNAAGQFSKVGAAGYNDTKVENNPTTTNVFIDDNSENYSAVQEWINNTLPVLEKHLQHAKEVKQQLIAS